MQGFAEAHVIGEDTAEVVGAEIGEEVKPFELVRPQLGAEAGGQRGRDPRLQLGRTAVDGLGLGLGEKPFRGRVGKLEGVEPLRFVAQFPGREPEPGELFVLFLGEFELQFAPALFLQPHVTALRGEQQLDFCLRQFRVGDVEDHAQVKPVRAGLRGFELHGAGDGSLRERGELPFQLEFDLRRHGGDPRGKLAGELLRDALGERALPAVKLAVQRGHQRRHGRERGAVVEDNGVAGLRVLACARGQLLGTPAGGRPVLQHRAIFRVGLHLHGAFLHGGIVARHAQGRLDAQAQGHGLHALLQPVGQLQAELAQQLHALALFQGGGRNAVFRRGLQNARQAGRTRENGAGSEVEHGIAGHDE